MDHLGRPDWDTYFLTLAFVVSQRSLDPNTKHGCVVTDNEHTVLALGYNSPPRGCDDNKVPLTRPLKYYWFVHSEEAAILNAARTGVSLKNSTFYITGSPCIDCLRKIISVGADKIVYGPLNSACLTDEMKQQKDLMLKDQNIVIKEIKTLNEVSDLINKTKEEVK